MVFGKNAPAAAKPTQLVNIPEGTVFTGNITAMSPVRIDGELNGNLSTESSVALGSTSRIKGNMAASDITIGGIMVGDIESKGIVVVASPGSLKGNVRARGFSAEMGSAFSGLCEVTPDGTLYLPPEKEKERLKEGLPS